MARQKDIIYRDNRLKELMAEKGWDTRRMAEEAFTSTATVYSILRGEWPKRFTTRVPFWKALGCTEEDIWPLPEPVIPETPALVPAKFTEPFDLRSFLRPLVDDSIAHCPQGYEIGNVSLEEQKGKYFLNVIYRPKTGEPPQLFGLGGSN